jgi:uncharacterized membrane protein YjgN (DUF898 family)
MEDTRQAPATGPQSFDFTGEGFDYFRIWIVNLALTIVTLGIFSAWAKVRRLRYFYGHTQLDGHRFDYLADPVKILKGRILAVLLLVAYSVGTSLLPGLAFMILVGAALLVPLVVVTASAFAMRNTAYRNVRFGFTGRAREAYAVLLPPLGAMLLIAGAFYFATDPEGYFNEDTGEQMSRADLLPSFISLALLPVLPWLDWVRVRFVISNTRFGNLQASLGASLWDFYKLYLQFLLVIIASVIGLFVVLFIVGAVLGVFGAVSGAASDGADTGPPGVFIALLVLCLYAFLFMAGAWFAANRANLLRNTSTFGANPLQGNFLTGDLLKLYLGNVIMIMLTLGLFIPFAAVRLHRYNVLHTAAGTEGVDGVVAVAQEDRSAFGEEIGELFDVDIGL